jgi:hypothetical protein
MVAVMASAMMTIPDSEHSTRVTEIAGPERTVRRKRMRGHVGVAAGRSRAGHGKGQRPGRKQGKEFFHNPLLKQYHVLRP